VGRPLTCPVAPAAAAVDGRRFRRVDQAGLDERLDLVVRRLVGEVVPTLVGDAPRGVTQRATELGAGRADQDAFGVADTGRNDRAVPCAILANADGFHAVVSFRCQVVGRP